MFYLIWEMGILLLLAVGFGVFVGYQLWSGDARSAEADAAIAENARLRQENENLARRLGDAESAAGLADERGHVEMQPLMNELVRALEEDGEIPPELAVKIEQLNANLIGQVPALLKAGLPGRGPNGAYTHPLVVSNILAKTLQAAGKPLDQAQSAALSGLVKSFGSELDRRPVVVAASEKLV